MTETSYAQIPAGWYPDPRGSKQRRWWDGSSWTHALEALPETTGAAAPGYANLPGPKVGRTPSASAPTVARAIDAEPSEHFPTRRQLRDAAAVIETQKQFAQAESSEDYAMGPAVSATQKPNASFSIEQFRNVAGQTPTEHLTKDASALTKSPAISTASPAPVSSASVTGPPVSAVPQTHTFSARAAVPAAGSAAGAAVPALPAVAEKAAAAASVDAVRVDAAPVGVAPVGVAPVEVAPATPKPFDASEFINPVIPVNPAAQAAKALAAATAAAAAKNAQGSDKGFVPVMRSGAPQTLQNEIPYQPFGMTPRITTGVVEKPTSVNTVSVWAVTLTPLIYLAAAFAFIRFAPEFYTPFIQGGLIFLVMMTALSLAIRDRQQLTARSHRSTASPAWVFLTPLAYLVARAVRTKQQAGRGWMPAIAFVVVSLVAAAVVLFAPLPLSSYFV